MDEFKFAQLAEPLGFSQDRQPKFVDFLTKVQIPELPTFSKLYEIVELCKIVLEKQLTEYFWRERMCLVSQQRYFFQTEIEAILSFSMLAYARKISQQEGLKADVVEVFKNWILEYLEVPVMIYQQRLDKEMTVWNDKQKLELSPYPILRKQGYKIRSVFTDYVEKLNNYKHNYNSSNLITRSDLRRYISRLSELREEYPDHEPCYFDVLFMETQMRPDRIQLRLERDGFKVSIKNLEDFTFIF